MSVLEDVRWDDRGLCVAIAQDRLGGALRMVAWMNREALAATLESGRATFFSRSRGRLWVKGEESGNVLAVRQVAFDCDADAILLLVDPTGPSCHTGETTCFFRALDPGEDPATEAAHPIAPAVPLLDDLEREIASRKASDAQKSYTRSLLDAGPSKIGEKLREEADELARAVAAESDERVASEAADVLYHAMVALAARDVPLRAVLAELARRRGVSGHDEKRARTKG
ncbi:MAG: bifunctional phosphoribosyl-AMP cyclohydrolase/phosphoribosyl-ATP diphosphatase HisIE [Deltaproteobacteria bacterium]|nr:bifunctional phosphoribosyl-AMP cyclohydrolase/phosphoribosyl-ATP diphosphatase HisIE [Deltaproteobacteria bacterium]